MTTPADGTPLVLMNAFPVDRSQWEGLVAALSSGPVTAPGDVISFDFPGIGDMPMTDEEPSLELIADAAVVAMREATGHDAAIWVGCSMGGYVAMAVAQREPTAVAGLGLIGTKSTADDAAAIARRMELAAAALALGGHPDPTAAAGGLIGTSGAGRDALVGTLARNVARQSGAGIAWGQRAMAARPDRTEVLRTIDAPAVVIHGQNDSISSLHDARHMAAALGVDAIVLPGVGHLAAFEDPHAVARALAPVLAPVSA